MIFNAAIASMPMPVSYTHLFGLGFYSAFMVAEEVHIDTLSYKEGAAPVHWTCDGGTEYDICLLYTSRCV